MGRELKRVPLDFNAPLNEVWEGYLNPYPGPLQCNLCKGDGYNLPTLQLANDFYSFNDRSLAWHDKITQDEVEALVAAGRLVHFTHVPTVDGFMPKVWKTKGFWCPGCHTAVPQLSPEHHSGYCTECRNQAGEDMPMLLLEGDDPKLHIPSAEEVNLLQHAGSFLLSHDGINRHILIEARAKRLGFYGHCAICNGEGEVPQPDEAIRRLHEEWQEYDPPAGEGYQLWSNTTEGSPLSPVFATAEELAEWCEPNATLVGSEGTSKANWLAMFTGEASSLSAGSLLILVPGEYCGAYANAPKHNES